MELCNSVPLLGDWSWESNRAECSACFHTQRNSPNLCVNKCSVSSNALSTTRSDLVVSRLLSPLCFTGVSIFPVCSFFLKKDEVSGKKNPTKKEKCRCLLFPPLSVSPTLPSPYSPFQTTATLHVGFASSLLHKIMELQNSLGVGRDLEDHLIPTPHLLIPFRLQASFGGSQGCLFTNDHFPAGTRSRSWQRKHAG